MVPEWSNLGTWITWYLMLAFTYLVPTYNLQLATGPFLQLRLAYVAQHAFHHLEKHMQDVSLDFHFLHWMVPKIYHMLHVWNMYQHLPKKSPSYVGKMV